MGANTGTYVQLAGAASKAVGAYGQSEATKAALETQSTVAAQNAQIGQWQAQSALDRGAREEQAVRMRGAQQKGTQIARFAANGIQLDSGSALDVLTSGDYMTNVDAATAHDNAAQEAWAYRIGANNASSRASLLSARADATNGGAAALSSLLTDGGQVATRWFALKKQRDGASGGALPQDVT